LPSGQVTTRRVWRRKTVGFGVFGSDGWGFTVELRWFGVRREGLRWQCYHYSENYRLEG
jgi:hypothetical protein